MLGTLKTTILFILMLTAIVSIHEFGHFLAAKFFNVYVAEFSIGMGKLLYQKQGKETKFSIRLLPIGGYCSMVGDNENDLEETPDFDETTVPYERTLRGIAKWKKIIILLAGVIMNVFLALVIVAGIYLYNGQAIVSPKAIISEVVEGTPAYNAGLMKDDEIIKCEYSNGYSIKPNDFLELSDFLALYEEGEITLTIKRNNEELSINLTPVLSSEKDGYMIGIKAYDYDIVNVNIFNCFGFAFDYLSEMYKFLITTLLGLFRGVNLDSLSGPVGIYKATSDAVSMGYISYLILIAIFSLNIGVFNLIPIPALDGGRIVLTIVEAIIRRPIPKKVEKVIMSASVLLFMALLLFATSQDILRLFK